MNNEVIFYFIEKVWYFVLRYFIILLIENKFGWKINVLFFVKWCFWNFKYNYNILYIIIIFYGIRVWRNFRSNIGKMNKFD